MQKTEIINRLKDSDRATVLIGWPHPKHPGPKNQPHQITGTVRKGPGYFYIVPDGDSHPGASITAASILEFISTETAEDRALIKKRDKITRIMKAPYRRGLNYLKLIDMKAEIVNQLFWNSMTRATGASIRN